MIMATVQVMSGEEPVMTTPVVTERDGTVRPAAVGVPVFTGRDHELAALASVLGSPPATVLIEGEAGIGKSRLVAEYVRGSGTRALVARCPPFRSPHTLAAVVDALRQAAGAWGEVRLSGLGGALRPLFPEWADWLPGPLEPAGDTTAAWHRVFAALAELIVCRKIGLLIVEDVHWADEATLEFLLYLASLQPRPVSLVATFRPEDVADGSLLPRLARLATGASGLRLALGPLGVVE